MLAQLETTIFGTTFKNPIWVASGTFGYGREFQEFFDINNIGAIVTKTVTLNPKIGNPAPRIVETASGLLNAIGLENPGVDAFISKAYPFLRKLNTKVIISLSGNCADDFIKCIDKLSENDFPAAFELNLSCPNIQNKCLIAQDKTATQQIITEIRKATNKKIIAKLSPAITDISEIAQAAEKGGADAVSLVNTYPGMAVDTNKMSPVLANITGGLSGPAIKPLALKAVYDAYKKVNIPIIGIGGISKGTDVAEFMLCGANATQIGTANLVDPAAYPRIQREFAGFLSKKKLFNPKKLVGGLQKTL